MEEQTYNARVDLKRFAEILRQRQTSATRFRVDRYVEDVPNMLYECYRYQVEKRGYELIFDDSTKDHIRRAAKWLVNENANPGLFICGRPGNGKTTLALAIQQLINVLYDSALSTERKYLRKVPASLLVEAVRGEKNSFLDELKTTELLYIDDIGTELSSVKVWGNEVSPLVDLLYHRYDRQLFTILTSNLLTEEDITNRYGPRITDRFAEMFDTLMFENKSYRQQVRHLPKPPITECLK